MLLIANTSINKLLSKNRVSKIMQKKGPRREIATRVRGTRLDQSAHAMRFFCRLGFAKDARRREREPRLVAHLHAPRGEELGGGNFVTSIRRWASAAGGQAKL